MRLAVPPSAACRLAPGPRGLLLRSSFLGNALSLRRTFSSGLSGLARGPATLARRDGGPSSQERLANLKVWAGSSSILGQGQRPKDWDKLLRQQFRVMLKREQHILSEYLAEYFSEDDLATLKSIEALSGKSFSLIWKLFMRERLCNKTLDDAVEELRKAGLVTGSWHGERKETLHPENDCRPKGPEEATWEEKDLDRKLDQSATPLPTPEEEETDCLQVCPEVRKLMERIWPLMFPGEECDPKEIKKRYQQNAYATYTVESSRSFFPSGSEYEESRIAKLHAKALRDKAGQQAALTTLVKRVKGSGEDTGSAPRAQQWEADDVSQEEKAAHQAAIAALDAIEAGQHHLIERSGVEPSLHQFSGAWVYTKIVSSLVEDLIEMNTRRGAEPDFLLDLEACKLLRLLLEGQCCPNKRGKWWIMLAKRLECLKRKDEALQAARDGLQDKCVRSGDRLELEWLQYKLEGKPLKSAHAWIEKELKEAGVSFKDLPGPKLESIGPEMAAFKDHYSTAIGGGYTGAHVEGRFFKTIFGLLLWDAIFADVPNAFAHPLQDGPLDLETPDFYRRRKGQFEESFACLRNMMDKEALVDKLSSGYASHYKTRCACWEPGDRVDLQQLCEFARCVGGERLAKVLRLLAEDYAAWAYGMPDLMLWNTASGEVLLVEVKTTDKLSWQQVAWLLELQKAGFRCEVVRLKLE